MSVHLDAPATTRMRAVSAHEKEVREKLNRQAILFKSLKPRSIGKSAQILELGVKSLIDLNNYSSESNAIGRVNRKFRTINATSVTGKFRLSPPKI